MLTGFKKGGYTGDEAVDKIAGVTHGKEFVIDAPTTEQMGLKGETMGGFKNRLYSGTLFTPKQQAEQHDERLYHEVKKLNQTLSKKKDQFIDIDKFGNTIERLEASKYRETIVRKRNLRRWR